MNKRDKMYNEISNHGSNLNKIFCTNYDDIKLCKMLRRFEHKGHQLAIDYCNGNIDIDQYDTSKFNILDKIDKILNFRSKKIPVFFNGDPRGYCLKIDDKYIRENKIKIYTDMGGYGILAPDFSE